jgi:hypothetical protein
MSVRTVYQCSDGRYYGDVDIWERLESGTWRPFCWDEETGEEWVISRDGELLALEPVDRESVSDRRLRRVAAGVSVEAGEPTSESERRVE